MYHHILITTDGSELAQQGVVHGLALAAAVGAQVTLLTVTPPYPIMAGMMGEGAYTPASVLEDYDRAQREQAEAVLKAAEASASADLTVRTQHIANAQPADAIIRAAQEIGCDLICMASHGRRGIRRMLLGSQAAQVVSQSPVPVLIVR